MEMPSYAPFARSYDLEYGALRDDLAFYGDLAERLGGPVLELAIGTGRVAMPIARAGVPVVGIDTCPEMLAVLAEKVAAEPGLDITWDEGDMRSFDLHADGPFPLVICPGRAFLHCVTVEDQLNALACVWHHLEEGGRFAANFFFPDIGLIERFSRGASGWEHGHEYADPGDGHRVLVSHRNHHDPRTQTIHAQLRCEHLSADGDVVRTEIREHLLCWIWPRELEHLLARAGFELEQMAGDYDGTPYPEAAREILFVARKRER
jgi:SAM-dependent methyltransferase